MKNNLSGIYYRNISLSIFLFFNIFFSCDQKIKKHEVVKKNKIIENHKTRTTKDSIGDIEKLFLQHNLVDIKTIDSSIHVDLKYATTDNFTGINLYGNLKKCYLQKDVAIKISLAQKKLKQINPDYSLIIFDGARPLQIQQIMWDKVKLPIEKKIQYLSNPSFGSLHNYGAAVDLSIIDLKSHHEIDMGTPFDFMGEKAMPLLEKKLQTQGILSNVQIENRKLLRKIMIDAGFKNLQTEWWHFNSCSRKKARQLYALLQKDSIHESNKNIEVSEEEIYFSVQLTVSSQPLDTSAEQFSKIPVKFYKHQGEYKYISGKFKKISIAYEACDFIKSTSAFKNAFVIAFAGQKRISLQDALELTQ